MKLLITGKPKSGKSTILSELIGDITPRRGFVTKEIVKDQRRIGFMIENMANRSAVLAQTENQSSLRVGRFYIQPQVLTKFIEDLSFIKADEFLYIDEIGSMQLHSKGFKTLVEKYLDAPNDFVATITSIYSNNFTKHILTRGDIILFYLTEETRTAIKESLTSTLKNKNLFNRLSPNLQETIVKYANDYLSKKSFIPFNKLFNNAIKYFLEGRISVYNENLFTVKGNTDKHNVKYRSDSSWSCDCPLSNGKAPYNIPADCSHIQAIRLYKSHLENDLV